MYLKSLEIYGFKSFANKIVFQFHNGITGIVGPNGSGKSNVGDAVRWVLGEQKVKQLRGTSMQDVIFSGTETRKPLSYAYVAMTLDNSDHQLAVDYHEVTVTRRIYRSGESEYRMNGTLCRLKDINELFYDTGIGKEGYSIIGQGQIDKILSGKPEERRELFDEAAGIVKFKRRKAAAQGKLENEKQNLVRVKDILAELEKQIHPLEKQAETARIYLKKREELKTLDINVFLLENNQLKEQQQQMEKKYKIAEEELQDTKKQYEDIKIEYEQLQMQEKVLEQEIEEARTNLADSNLLKSRMEGQINVWKEQIHSAQNQEEHFRNRYQSIQSEIKEKEKNKGEIENQKKEIDIKVQYFIKEKEIVQKELENIQQNLENLSKKIEDGNNKIILELNRRAAIKSQIGRLDTMIEQIAIQKAEINGKFLRAKSEEADREEKLQELETIFAKIKEELYELQKKEKEKEAILEKRKEELTQKDRQLREVQTGYHQKQSKLDAFVNLTQRYEGYGTSIKRIMEQKEKENGIIGVVADIIKADKKYETAIETALGASIQNIVTKDEDTAKKMIEYLKKNKLGRATFLPLSSVTASQTFTRKEVLKEAGVIGLAQELVQVEESYLNIAKALLGRIVVVDNINYAVKIAKKYDYSLRIVTLEGELLTPGGAISGGAFQNNSNLLGRRREIEELKKEVSQFLEKIQIIQKEIENIKKDRNQVRIELEALKAEIQQKTIEQNTAKLNKIQAQERIQEEEKSFFSLKQEQKKLEAKRKEAEFDKEQVMQQLKESEEIETQTQKQIITWQKELEGEQREEKETAAKEKEWDKKAEKMLQMQSFHQTNIERIFYEIGNFQNQLKEMEEELKTSTKEAKQKEKQIQELEKNIVNSLLSQENTENQLKEKIKKKEKLAAKQQNFFQLREEAAEHKTALDKEVYRLGIQKEKLEEVIENQINYMWEEYEITLSQAVSMQDKSKTNLSSMKKDIIKLKEEIKKLGDVNVNAIEDYKSVMERYTFMKTQHNDLIEAEKTLEGLIQELDSAMRKQFTEKFAQISKEFDKVFKEMFGGGKGTLELIEEQDILEAGIRIIAQPPGKKLQNMMQLSGGEKALTAIALLFAIQNLKPSPFCLLDEIEAALDESNVERFAKYLHKLTKNTQFIVITHRRGTMQQVDRLYGITMQEKGVSTLVSVNLIDKELEN